jgi:hypothetical protein
MGGTWTARLKGREDGVEDLGDGATRHTCGYGRDGNEPFALSVIERPDPNGTVVASTTWSYAMKIGTGARHRSAVGGASGGRSSTGSVARCE